MKALGAVIRNQRARLGLTQEELADRMAELGDTNIRQSDISRIERGQVQLPHFDRLRWLSETLDMTIGELFVRAGWIQIDEVIKVLGEEVGYQYDSTEFQPLAGNSPQGSPVDATTHSDENTRPDHEHFERHRSEFERVRELYEHAKAEHEQHQDHSE